MERYFILDKFNTWYDWGAILTAKDVTPPEPNTNYVTIDGMSGSLDLSEALTGEITYKDRTVSASFWTDKGTVNERAVFLRDIAIALHGKKIRVIEPDDPEHYFLGRVRIKSQKNILAYTEFSLEITCDPWRYSLEETNRTVELSDKSIDVIVRNDGVKTLIPVVTVTGSVDITYNGVKTSLADGYYVISSLTFKQGISIVNVSGEGSVTFTYREATL